MKKLRFFYFSALAVVLCMGLSTSCSKEPSKNDPKGNTTLSISYKAPLAWTAGESVAVMDPSIGAPVSMKVSADGKSIVGDLSSGDYPVKAVYPSEAVGYWAADSELEISIPSEQYIEDGASVAKGAYVQVGTADSKSQTVEFKPYGGTLSFTLNTDIITEVVVSLSEGGSNFSYTVIHEGGAFKKGTYSVVVPQGKYKVEGICNDKNGRLCQFSAGDKTVSAGQNYDMGTVDGGSWTAHYTMMQTGTFPDFNTFLDQGGLDYMIDPSYMALIKMLAPGLLSKSSDQLKSYTFMYPSIDPKGNIVYLSAIMYIPASAVNSSVKGIVLANHFSIGKNEERPTAGNDFHKIAAWADFAVVIPDYNGFGEDAANPQAYLNPEVAGCCDINALLAARWILKDKTVNVSVGAKLYNIGYSQGGFNGMANERYVAQNPNLNLHFTKTFVGGSPFDPSVIWEEYLADNYPHAVGYLPITICSFNECEKLGLDYKKMFKEPLASHVQDWILSKNYTVEEISSKVGATSVKSILTDSMLDTSSAQYKALIAVAKKYSLCEGWAPQAGSNISVYHSTQDDVVPYACYTKMKEYMQTAGTGSTVTFTDGEGGSHTSAAAQWLLPILSELSQK